MLRRRFCVVGKPKLVRWQNGNPVIRIRYRWTGQPVRQVTREVKRLLSDGNTKLRKGKAFVTWGLSLSPADQANVGDLCPWRTDGCTSSCLDETGMGIVFQTIRVSRALKSAAFMLARKWFLQRLNTEIQEEHRKAQAKGMPMACRLNVFSDIVWEKIAPELFRNNPGVQFYDYTKAPTRAGQRMPNYWVTFSRSEVNDVIAVRTLNAGKNVAVAFRDELPKTWKGFRVIDGDQDDLRFLDPRGVVVGLSLKAGTLEHRQAAIESGFAV